MSMKCVRMVLMTKIVSMMIMSDGFPQVFDSLSRAVTATEHAASMSRQAATVFDDQAASLNTCRRMLDELMRTSRV